MEAIKRQPQAPKNRRGFYVRMKFLDSNKSHGSHRAFCSQQEKSFFYRYYKWLLWLCLSLYFLSPYLITTTTSNGINDDKQLTSLPKPSAIASRTLIDVSQPQQLSLNLNKQQGLMSSSLKDLKIYIYDLPPEYNANWLNNERCSNHLFASEVAIHRALSTSEVRTFDPFEADFFLVPVYVSCNFSAVNGFPAIGHARSLLSSAVKLISSDYTFWNRSLGSDHIFVASHDFGACFHTLENVAIEDGIPGFLKGSIMLQTFGVKSKHPCQDVENVVIPPYVSPESVRTTLKRAPGNGRRDIFAFFRGKMEVHPKNVSGRFYSKKVRTEIWRTYGNDRRFYLQRHRFAGYQSEIVRSVFCLCPLGWAPWSPRLVESVALGCVPVIIADDIRLPFPAAARWPEISLTVAERDVGKLGMILEHVAATNLTRIQKNLMDPGVARALLFNNHIEYGDATWQVLSALADKLNRSSRRSLDSTQ